MNRPEAGAWPLIDRADDPWPWVWPDDDLGYADAVASPWIDARPQAAYRQAALSLQAWLDQVNRDPAAWDPAALRHLAIEAQVPIERRMDRRPVQPAPRLMSETEILRIGLDGQPDAGLRSVDEVLGPWVEALSPTDHRGFLVCAAAHWCLSGDRPPAWAWTRSRPTPSHAERAAARALVHAPLNLWTASSTPSGWRLTDRIGIASHRLPTAPVSLHSTGLEPVEDGDPVLARLLPAGGRWHAWGAMTLPAPLPPARSAAIVDLVLVALRLRNRRATVEDALRTCGHQVARRLFVAAYRAAPHA